MDLIDFSTVEKMNYLVVKSFIFSKWELEVFVFVILIALLFLMELFY